MNFALFSCRILDFVSEASSLDDFSDFPFWRFWLLNLWILDKSRMVWIMLCFRRLRPEKILFFFFDLPASHIIGLNYDFNSHEILLTSSLSAPSGSITSSLNEMSNGDSWLIAYFEVFNIFNPNHWTSGYIMKNLSSRRLELISFRPFHWRLLEIGKMRKMISFASNVRNVYLLDYMCRWI